MNIRPSVSPCVWRLRSRTRLKHGVEFQGSQQVNNYAAREGRWLMDREPCVGCAGDNSVLYVSPVPQSGVEQRRHQEVTSAVQIILGATTGHSRPVASSNIWHAWMCCCGGGWAVMGRAGAQARVPFARPVGCYRAAWGRMT